MIWKLTAAATLIGFSIVFAWPWVSPYLERRDQPHRLLDALREEWDKESDEIPPRYDGRPW